MILAGDVGGTNTRLAWCEVSGSKVELKLVRSFRSREQAAGMDVLAVTTPFTKEAFRRENLLDRRWVVDDPEELPTVMWECLLAHQRDTHGG